MDEYKFEGHRFHKHKSIPWYVCACCGLITLNNKMTEWCRDKGCNYPDHPSYQSKVKQLTKWSKP